MIVYAANDRAANGRTVSTSATLDLDAVGEVDRPFFVASSVDGCRMGHSFHRTMAEAQRAAEGSHAAYLEVHKGRGQR